ncbi:MAG: hypothetical protein J7599_20690 [Niabella sp.]|nr:hypothetical protein [Niabella sp.]
MIGYLLKVIACSGLLYAFYYCFLQKEKMLVFNRCYLLGSLLVSFLIPLPVIQIRLKPAVLQSSEITIVPDVTAAAAGATFAEALIPLVFWLTGIISSILLLRFVVHLFQISRKIKGNEQRVFETARLVLLQEPVMPHSFFKYVFLNKRDFEHNRIEAAILVHELSHVRQKHTWDIVLAEFIGALMWFNPFFLLYRRAIRLNHEFLADQAAAGGPQQRVAYQQLLLKSIYVNQSIPLASSFYFLTTKKRLLMLQKKTSFLVAAGKAVMIAPLAGGLMFLFAERVYAQEEPPKIVSVTVSESRRDGRSLPGDVESLAVTSSKDKRQKTAELTYKNGTVIRGDISTKAKEVAFERRYGVKITPPPPPQAVTKQKMPEGIGSVDVITPKGKAVAVLTYRNGKTVKADISSGEKQAAFESRYSVKIPPPPPPPAPREALNTSEPSVTFVAVNSQASASTSKPQPTFAAAPPAVPVEQRAASAVRTQATRPLAPVPAGQTPVKEVRRSE